MSVRAWAVALQAPLFSAVVAPAAVGVVVAWRAGAAIASLPLVLVFGALVLIQAGANLQKGLVESADRPGRADAAPSVFVFDSAAVERLGWERARLRRLAQTLFGLGALLGLVLVLAYGDLVLLALGAAGGLLGYFYSAPPLKLSYRGVGEIATFLAFGPFLVAGVAYLFARAFLGDALWTGTIVGFLAALISYVRYFPVAREDREKGKRTPVVRLGPEGATAVLWVLLAAPYGTALLGGLLGTVPLLAFLVTVPLAFGLVRAHGRGLVDPRRFGASTRWAVLLQGAGAAVLVAAYGLV
jgi:1,4-dihydroxy-2-naphthoate octaprenyltransferase